MSLFDRIFGKKKEEVKPAYTRPQNKEKIKRSKTRDGRNVFEYCDEGKPMSAKYKSSDEFYDTTKMVIDNFPRKIQGKKVYDIMVSWRNSSYTIIEEGIPIKYEHILAEVDKDRLEQDEEYLKYVMKDFLERERIKEYLSNGLETEGELKAEEKEAKRTGRGTKSHYWPCGIYVGGVRQKGNEFGKFFDVDFGKKIHNSPEMVEARAEHRTQKAKEEEEERKRKVQAIREKKENIARLQREVEEDEQELR